MKYDAVIFDNDGVLTTMTDHSGSYATATADALVECGLEPAEEDVEAVTNAIREWRDGFDALFEICDRHGVDADEFWRIRERLMADAQLEQLRSNEKTLHNDVSSIHSLPSELDFAIVSNNQQRTIDHIVDHFDLADAFETWYGREPTLDGLRTMKPHPELIERTIAELGTHDVLLVGDSSNDVGAAINVGIDCAFVRRPRKADLELSQDPTYEIGRLDELSTIIVDERDASETNEA